METQEKEVLSKELETVRFAPFLVHTFFMHSALFAGFVFLSLVKNPVRIDERFSMLMASAVVAYLWTKFILQEVTHFVFETAFWNAVFVSSVGCVATNHYLNHGTRHDLHFPITLCFCLSSFIILFLGMGMGLQKAVTIPHRKTIYVMQISANVLFWFGTWVLNSLY